MDMRTPRLEPVDAAGRTLKPGHVVRVVGAPELKGISGAALREARAAFRHLIGTYRTIDSFDRYGFAEIFFRVRRGRLAGLHSVAIEPFLLRRKRARSQAARRTPVKR
jgi:hypothetical protein